MDSVAERRSPGDFDPISHEVLQCPYPFLETLQRAAPVYRVAGADYFIISRYEDVQSALRDAATFSSDFLSRFEGRNKIFVPEPVLNHSDPPIHGRTKPIGVRAFGPGLVKAIEADIQKLVDRLIDRFIDRGEVELFEEFAMPLPVAVIAGQLGIPDDNLATLKLWSDQMPVFSNRAATEADRIRAGEILVEANACLMRIFHEKRENPTDDVISALAAATVESSPEDGAAKPRLLTEGEALSMMQLFLVGGNDNTTNALMNGMLILLRNPEALEDLRSGRKNWSSATEEFIRLESPVKGLWRLTTREVELGGVTIPADTPVFLSIAASSRDPSKFPDPNILDLSRANLSGQLGFGHGIHLCVGSRLARKEMEITYETLFRRLQNIRLTPDKNDFDNLYLPSTMARSIRALHLSFDRANAA